MKHFILSLALGALLVTSCKKSETKGGEAKEVVEVTESVNYSLDTAKSIINWQGYKITDGEEGGHYGTLQLNSEGQFQVKDSALVGGKFSVDMKSLVVTDIEDEENKSKLEIHLKNEDFFNVENFPKATFEITSVSPMTEGDFNTKIEGNFTINGNTKSYNFLANTKDNGASYEIKTNEFMLNRQDFGVAYMTQDEKDFKDKFIKDDIKLQIVIVGDKM